MIYISIFLPLIISVILYLLKMEMNTGEFLSLTLQIVWGIMISLGGSVIYLTKFKFKDNNSKHVFRKIVTDYMKWLCFPLIIQTLIFIFIAIFYPLREFLSNRLSINTSLYQKLAIAIDSFLVGLISIPSVFSILIGLWCIYLAIYHENESNRF